MEKIFDSLKDKYKKSPCCVGANMDLFIVKRKHIIKNNVYEGNFYVLKCTECGEGFTTTESDEASLKQLKPKKL